MVEQYLNTTRPLIRRVAAKLGADIFFEDEAGVGIMTRSGHIWGAVNSPPTVSSSDQRGGYKVLSAITAREPKLHASLEAQSVGSLQYIEFLDNILHLHRRPIVIVADYASLHRSKRVRTFVRTHRERIRAFFLPKPAPHLSPDDRVWNKLKHRHIGREPIANQQDLKTRLIAYLLTAQTQCPKSTLVF